MSWNIDFVTLRAGNPVATGLTVSGGTFTAPRPGRIIVQTAVAAGQNVKFTLNGTVAGQTQSPSSTFVWIPFSMWLNQGDVLVATSSDNGGNGQVVPGQSRFWPMA